MPVTIFDLDGVGTGRSRRELPRVVAGALQLLWAAGRRELVVVVALEAVTAVLLGVAVVVGRDVLAGVLDADSSGAGWDGFLPGVAALVAVTVALGVAQAVITRQQQLLTELAGRHSQGRILDVACAVELAHFDDPAFHDRVTRAQVGAFRVAMVVNALLGMMRSAAGVVGSLVALAVLQPLLLPLAALAVVPALLVSSRRADAYYRFAYSMTPRDRERQYLAELLTQRDAAKEVRAMDLAGFLRARHDRLYDERVAELREVTRRQLRFSLLAALGTAATIGGALALLVALALSDQLSLAGAAAAAGAMALLGQRLAYGGFSAEQLLECAMFVEDYLAFVALAPPSSPPGEPSLPAAEPRAVVAEDVWFAYPGSDVSAVRGVSLRVDPGEIVALVGANGSGKTTLAKLLAALYVPDAGRVTIGGIDTAATDRPALRRGIGVVFQDFLRYTLPARDNIALGRHERSADDGAIVAAARRAAAHEDLAALRDGYDTRLGPTFFGGVDLSIGQWQKVAIARLFFRDAPFVILDEPTAALDARAEHELFARIRELFAQRSVLLISHRFSTVREADRIYVLDGGTVIEAGGHDELMALGGTYAELFSLQAAAYAS